MDAHRHRPGDAEFTRRLRCARVCFLLLFGIVFSALAYVQVFRHGWYQLQVMRQKYVQREEPVARGAILDRNGRPLAISVPCYSLYLDYWKIGREAKNNPAYPETLARTLAEVLSVPEEQLKERMKPPYPLIRRQLSPGEYERLSQMRLPGLDFDRSYARVYPCGRLACHAIGYVGAEGSGLEGVELYYDRLLRGVPAVVRVARDGQGNLIPSLKQVITAAEPGKDLVLTIDSRIQAIVEEEIASLAETALPSSVSAVVMDPCSGEILAMANLPDFDPGAPGRFSAAERRNRAVTDLFEPGSIFKIVTAAAAFEEGLVQPSQTIFCHHGEWSVRGHVLHDVHPYGNLSVEEVVVKSSNIGTVQIAMLLEEERLYRYCRAFGFGMPCGVDLPGEVKGVLRPLERWSGYSITAVPIGQEVGITSLQGIRAMAVIANGGLLVRPHVLKEIRSGREGSEQLSYPSVRILSPKTCQTVSEILEKVVSPEGTAPLAAIPGYRVCGKTGTAQKFEGGRYSSTKVVASFVGYLLNGQPDLVIAINVDEPRRGQYGGTVAAPAFRNIAWRVMQYWQIPPDEALKTTQVARRP